MKMEMLGWGNGASFIFRNGICLGDFKKWDDHLLEVFAVWLKMNSREERGKYINRKSMERESKKERAGQKERNKERDGVEGEK